MKVIIELRGGLGNQLFCYSFGYAMAKKNNAQLIIDSSMGDSGIQRKLEIQKFRIRYLHRITIKYTTNRFLRKIGYNYIRKKFSIGFFTKIYRDEECYLPYKEINISHNTYFKGYWQNYKFFDKYKNEIQDMIRLNYNPSKNFDSWLTEIKDNNSISIHIRRGDYINLGWQLDENYYKEAIDTINSKVLNGKYYVFSDDIDYCKKFLENHFDNIEVRYVEYESDNRTVEDMILMSNCKHMVIANSSYSWWAAYLNQDYNARIICPVYKQWKENFYPEKWKKIKVGE